MKASLKFREDQKPLVRAKIPLSILGFPFQSGIVAGESKELALNLATSFASGPSLKLAYRPNDSLNPFTFVFKTGIGAFGSPISSPMCMSAEFNHLGTQNPSFFIHFKPRFGDFCLKKSQSSNFVKSLKSSSNGAVSDDDGLIEVIETPVMAKGGYSAESGLFSGKRIAVPQAESPEAGLIGGLLSGAEASARTVVPIMNRAVVSFRWGLRVPPPESAVEAMERNPTAGISFERLPVLVMSKIGIEHVAGEDRKDFSKSPSDDVADACLGLKRPLEIIRAENGMLRKAMDDLKSEFSAGKWVLPAAGGGRVDRRSGGGDKKVSEINGFGDVNEELKTKAPKDAST
ncbi:POU domain, class 2, transcription factor 2 like [Actinidia chinensis var. chinensis]|uniref:POU domain, class 2, transcription factor 2 like n=1 Tax=Actinidia chinensis var. chinensis TaxID=1590841 RepID=A0A2R6QRS1_ACTCC|nr:POU domain, class 2, transcription factor 2 like [Actinidia chinensis var. chinensis]